MSETLGPRASRPHRERAGGTPAVPATGLRIDAARRGIARRFRDRGIDTPDLDARILVGHALGLDHTALALAGERRLEAAEIARIETLAARAVDRTGARSRALRIADLGVGSGAILIALLVELPNASAIGTDRNPAALARARENARRLGVAPRAAFVACDFGAAVAPGCDLVVTNPPYIRTDEIAALEPDVREFDPLDAIDGGLDGLAAYRVIAVHARHILIPGAHLIAEIGKGQGDAVAALFAAAGFGRIRIVPDLADISRAVVAVRNP